MTITVRQATPDDLDAIVMLLGELHDPSRAIRRRRAWKTILAQTGVNDVAVLSKQLRKE